MPRLSRAAPDPYRFPPALVIPFRLFLSQGRLSPEEGRRNWTEEKGTRRSSGTVASATLSALSSTLAPSYSSTMESRTLPLASARDDDEVDEVRLGFRFDRLCCGPTGVGTKGPPGPTPTPLPLAPSPPPALSTPALKLPPESSRSSPSPMPQSSLSLSSPVPSPFQAEFSGMGKDDDECIPRSMMPIRFSIGDDQIIEILQETSSRR
mmetsp:Transcript_29747/g.88244  ORF Transcript_29747/g.88244 Transcript_29747/m.88244 type:complete len:208 (-) Transcript_29747:1304-1927(-)